MKDTNKSFFGVVFERFAKHECIMITLTQIPCVSRVFIFVQVSHMYLVKVWMII